MADDVAMNDMEIEFDDPEIARLHAEANAIDARAEETTIEAMNGIEEAPEEGEIDASAPAPTKVHVRGVDNLNTFDIEDWAAEYYIREAFLRVQWIDDTSANLIYDSEMAAMEALAALSAEEVADPMQLRAAKPFPKNPDQELHVRLAIVADVKAPKAKDRSKFYLFHKEWDPDNPHNIRPDNRKRRWQDDEREVRKYRRREYRGRESPREQNQFHESMYDDDPKPEVRERQDSYASDSDYGRRRAPPREDLLANRQSGRLRDRSASPARDGDGRYGFSEVHPRRRTPRPRSPSPPPPPPGIRRGRDNHDTQGNLRKELFPDKSKNGHMDGATTSPLASRPPSTMTPSRELFPDKMNGSVHRRQSAKSLSASEVADAIGKYQLNNHAPDAFAYDRTGRRPGGSGSESEGGRDLFSRINGGGAPLSTSFGRLNNDPAPSDDSDRGFIIKGADQGFSIRGASRDRPQNPLVKELFPLKASSSSGGGGAGGEGKDLFDGRIKGRGAQRRRAEDLF